MAWVQTCPVEPVNGACPESLVWAEGVLQVHLTWEQFLTIVPAIVGALLTAYAFKLLKRSMFGR